VTENIHSPQAQLAHATTFAGLNTAVGVPEVKLMAQAALISNLNPYYTVPQGKEAVVKEIIFCNTSSSEVRVNLYFGPSNGQLTPAHAVLSKLPLQGHQTVLLNQTTQITSDTTIYLSASAGNVVAITISGIEIS
jgi:hypothetical protein